MSPQLLLAVPTSGRAHLVAHTPTDRPALGLVAADGWRVAFVRHRSVAEELLDYLKGRGVIVREVRALGPTAFAVRWRN